MFLSRSIIQSRIKIIRQELEARHQYGTVKIANADGSPIPTQKLQDELFSLIYRMSILEQ